MTPAERYHHEQARKAAQDHFYEAADEIATEFLATHYRNVRAFEVSILRNVITDVCNVAKDDLFIEKATTRAGGRNNAIARRVIELARPHLVDLCGRTYQKWRA